MKLSVSPLFTIWSQLQVRNTRMSRLHVGVPCFSQNNVTWAMPPRFCMIKALLTRKPATGNCPTVGSTGGYIQGGGHSPLSNKFGLAADNALEYEVVDGQGNFLIANRQENTDLFWALSGGGGGTYGVVAKVTVKAHETFPVTTNTLNFATATIPSDTLRGAVSALHGVIPALVDNGIYIINGFRGGYFTIQDLMAPGKSATEIDELLEPFLSYLNSNGIVYKRTVTEYDTYFDYYTKGGPSYYINNQANVHQDGNWLIPRHIATDSVKDAQYIDAVLNVAAAGYTIGTVGFNVSESVAGDVENAVLDAWRKALFYTIVVAYVFPSYVDRQ